MAKFTDAVRNVLVGYFNAGDQPTEAQFTELITAIQEGIEEHDHSGTGDGDGVSDLVGPLTGTGLDVPDDWYIGIGAALERITFDAAGDVTIGGANFGVGVGTPLKRAHVRESGIAGGFTVDANVRTVLVLEEGVSGARLCLAAPSDGSSAIDFSDEDDWNVGEILYNHADNFMTFRVNDAERVRITDAGVVKIAGLAGVGVRNVSVDADGNLVV